MLNEGAARSAVHDGAGADGGQEGGVAPGQVGDALLKPGGPVELSAKLEVVVVEDQRGQHLVSGGVQQVRGIRGRRRVGIASGPKNAAERVSTGTACWSRIVVASR